MFNYKLRAARMRKSWSMAKASEKVRVDRVTYSRWERGEQTPHPSTLDLLCQAFGMSQEELGFPLTISLEEPNQDAEQQIVRLTSDQLAILKVVLEGTDMTLFDPSKRETLRHVAMALGATVAHPQSLIDPEPWERLALAQTRPSALDNTALERFEHLIGEGWKLSDINQLEAAEGIVSSFLPQILAIPPRDTNERIAFIASQGLHLQSTIVHHRLQIGEKLRMCQRSVEYARQANDANTLVAALNELAVAYQFDGQTEMCLHNLQEALFYNPQASPLVQARIYSHYAAIVGNGRRREAEFYLGLAHEVFPDDPTLDPGYELSDSNVFILALNTGEVRLGMGQVSSAYEGYELYRHHPSGTNISERYRLEIGNGLSQTAILAGDQERYAMLLEDVLVGSYALGSKKRFDEALRIFHRLPRSWHTDRRIKDIAEKYHLIEGETD